MYSYFVTFVMAHEFSTKVSVEQEVVSCGSIVTDLNEFREYLELNLGCKVVSIKNISYLGEY